VSSTSPTQLSDRKVLHLKVIESKLRGELKQEDFDIMRDVLAKDITEIESARRAMIQEAEAALQHHHGLAKIPRAGEKSPWPPVTDRCGSDRGSLSEGNFLAQPHLQHFDFE
jgi:hypothetical protein